MTEPVGMPELDPTSVDELFKKDPVQLTDDEMRLVVKEIRAWREKQLEKARTKPKRASKKKHYRETTTEEIANLTINDLDLGNALGPEKPK